MLRTGNPGSIRGLQKLLQRGFGFLKRPWVKEYLLHPTPESDLSILTSKEQARNAFAGKMTMSFQEDLSDFSNIFSSNSNANWVFVPAYSIEGLSASILLKENFDMTRLSGAYHSPMQYIRFVRNDENGDVLGVSIDDDKDTIIIMVLLWDTPEHRHSCVMKFNKSPVLEILRAGGPFDTVRIEESAYFAFHTDEHKMCTKCNPFGLGALCSCPPPVARKPRYILDGAASAKNMLNHEGSFSGTCQCKLVTPQLGTVFSTLPVFGGMTGGTEPGVIPRLMTWGISKCITGSTPSPGWFPTSAVSRSDCSSRGEMPFPVLDFGEELASHGNSSRQLQAFRPDASGSDIGSGSDLNLFNSGAGNGSQLGICAEDNDTSTSQIIDNTLIAPDFDLTGAPGAGAVGPVPMASSLVSPGCSTSEPGGGNLALPSALLLPDTVPNLSGLRMVSTAPAAIASDLNCGSGALRLDLPKELTESEAKKLRRKLRNRESAARSNLKKRLHRKDLEDKISAEVGKMEMLKRKLGTLREENEALKKQVWKEI